MLINSNDNKGQRAMCSDAPRHKGLPQAHVHSASSIHLPTSQATHQETSLSVW